MESVRASFFNTDPELVLIRPGPRRTGTPPELRTRYLPGSLEGGTRPFEAHVGERCCRRLVTVEREHVEAGQAGAVLAVKLHWIGGLGVGQPGNVASQKASESSAAAIRSALVALSNWTLGRATLSPSRTAVLRKERTSARV